jgi:hypothetical protein
LLVLKQVCGHGNFAARLDVLGIDRGVAARFMSAAKKFSNVPSTAHLLPAIGTQTKLLELLVLDDEQIDELAETGQTGELKLDDVACMGVRELRKAVRELREREKAKNGVIEQKEKTISALQERLAAPTDDDGFDHDDAAPEPEPESVVRLAAVEKVVGDIEQLAVRLQSGIGDLRKGCPETPTRRAHETAALMRCFAALRTTAIHLDVAVSDDGQAEIDPEAGEEAIKREMQAVMRERTRGQAGDE